METRRLVIEGIVQSMTTTGNSDGVLVTMNPDLLGMGISFICPGYGMLGNVVAGCYLRVTGIETTRVCKPLTPEYFRVVNVELVPLASYRLNRMKDLATDRKSVV